jgi:hypothetical protein
MGKTNFAEISANIKRFFRNAGKLSVAILKVIGLFMVVVLGLMTFITFNAFAFATSLLWMPVVFKINPRWLARKIDQPMADDPWKFFLEGRHLAVFAFGWFFIYLGTRTWAPRKQRFEFLSRFGKDIKEYPVRIQIEFWEDSVYPENVFRCMSEVARIELLKKLLLHRKTETVIAMMKSYGKADKGRAVASLLGAIRDCDHPSYERKQVAGIILEFSHESYDLSMLSSSEVEELWQLPSKEIKLMLCFLSGMPLCYFSRLVCDKDTAAGDGLRVLKSYHSKKTFSDECVSYLIEVAPKRPQILSFLKEIILRNGISQANLEKIYATNISTFISEVEEVVEVRSDLDMLRGVASINLPEEVRKVENAERWSVYCTQRQVSELAQMKMSKEQYIAFRNAGQKLTSKALEHLLVNVNDSAYLTIVIRGEYEQLTPKMRTLLSAVAWKQRILVDVTAEKMAEEPIEL